MSIFGWFMFFTVLDSVVWNAAFIGLGWVLGSRWTVVEQYARPVEYVVLVALAIGLVWFVWRRWNVHA
jgi:membrane protein DedA with SNARE-associated domain